MVTVDFGSKLVESQKSSHPWVAVVCGTLSIVLFGFLSRVVRTGPLGPNTVDEDSREKSSAIPSNASISSVTDCFFEGASFNPPLPPVTDRFTVFVVVVDDTGFDFSTVVFGGTTLAA